MLDLVHFGVPTWLPDAFADADFPAALERFAANFGPRYAGPCSLCLPDQRTAHYLAVLRRHRPVATRMGGG